MFAGFIVVFVGKPHEMVNEMVRVQMSFKDAISSQVSGGQRDTIFTEG